MAKGRKAKKPKVPVKVEWERQPLIEKIVDELVSAHHPHLQRARIIALGRPTGSKKKMAVAKRASRAIQAIYKDAAGLDVHYLIEVGLDHWERLDARGRKILIDHELCHFAGLDDRGRWGMLDHEIEEFRAIVKRYGAYHADLAAFVTEAKQMSLVEADGK
jgi:predicted metallopeptidase